MGPRAGRTCPAAAAATRTWRPTTPAATRRPSSWSSEPPTSGSHAPCPRSPSPGPAPVNSRPRSRRTGSPSKVCRRRCCPTPGRTFRHWPSSRPTATTSCGPPSRPTGWPRPTGTVPTRRRGTRTCTARSGRSSPRRRRRRRRPTSRCTGPGSPPSSPRSWTTWCRPSGCARSGRSSGSPGSTPPTPTTRIWSPPVRLGRDASPSWVPAAEVRGEGLFLRLPEDRLRDWESRVAESAALFAHERAYGLFREKRRSSRLNGPFDPMAFWPGARYLAMHTFAHLMVRASSIECGYSSASLSERIYAGDDPDDPRSGILIYTAVPDAEGTLGGLVSLGEERDLTRLVRRALRDATHCSSDPLCAERLPAHTADFLHGAACHVCLFVSETTCERGNRFLDRRFVVPIDPETPALFPDLP
ncbi:DrmB family protein [Pseudonocardia alni]|uniref:DrmB family protein n=1 Tax=Pseudonocardia alni TaxID=33907 RepID=UPI001FCB1136|nr:DrmB family protein [Pseudonocardia alni]